MKIYYKENTGLKTAQAENSDYFTVDLDSIQVKYNSKKWYVDVLLWEKQEHAQGNKPANLGRTIVSDITKEANLDEALSTLFTSDTLTTTNSETISLKGATEI